MLAGLAEYDRKGQHYTALVFRRGDRKWLRYDDLQAKTTQENENIYIQPALAVFIKCEQ